MTARLPHATTRLPAWLEAWRRSGRLVLLLDFDGTLAPIVARPELARPLPAATAAIERLRGRGDVELAIISGRGLNDARRLARVEGIVYAGNHGMEIEGPGVHEVHAEARAARPLLERVVEDLERRLASVPGALVEDKGLTLSVHYRLVDPDGVPGVRDAVLQSIAPYPGLRVTEGKMVLEIRPRVEWDKGRAVDFLLAHLEPPPGAPVLYLGDDTTDEDAFRALARRGDALAEGILVAERPPVTTAARSYLRTPAEVAELLAALAAA